MFKAVAGSPLQADMSFNFLLYEKLTLGTGYRWDAALSALAGFQFTDQIFIGFGYDFATTEIKSYSGGSYEFMLRFDVFNKPERILTPRFFKKRNRYESIFKNSILISYNIIVYW